MTPTRRTAATTLALALAGVITLVLSSGRATFQPEQATRSVVGTFQRGFSSIGEAVGGTVRSVGELRRLRREYESLLSELEQYERMEGRLQSLERENARLREQLEFAARTDHPVVSARVIARDAATGLFSSFTVNRGRRHGIHVGQPVMAFVGGREGLIGRVVEVTGGTSRVLPVFAPGSFVASRLERSRYEGLIEGTGDAAEALVMRYVPRDGRDEIQYDDLVVTSGMNSVFPQGLPVGSVRRVESRSWQASLVITVEPIVDYARLEYVFILATTGTERDE